MTVPSLTERTEQIIQGILATLLVVGAVGVTILLIVRGESIDHVPQWLTLALGAILGFYFGQRATASGVAKATNGMISAAQSMTNQVLNATDPNAAKGPPAA